MSSKKISSLTDRITITGTELIPVAINGLNYSITPSELNTYIHNNPTYKEYICNLTQGNTSAPTVVILNNTFGVTVTWTRYSTGVYRGTFSSSVLTQDYTMVLFHNASGFGSGTGSRSCAYWDADNRIVIETRNSSNAAADGYLLGTSLEVRVYNT